MSDLKVTKGRDGHMYYFGQNTQGRMVRISKAAYDVRIKAASITLPPVRSASVAVPPVQSATVTVPPVRSATVTVPPLRRANLDQAQVDRLTRDFIYSNHAKAKPTTLQRLARQLHEKSLTDPGTLQLIQQLNQTLGAEKVRSLITDIAKSLGYIHATILTYASRTSRPLIYDDDRGSRRWVRDGKPRTFLEFTDYFRVVFKNDLYRYGLSVKHFVDELPSQSYLEALQFSRHYLKGDGPNNHVEAKVNLSMFGNRLSDSEKIRVVVHARTLVMADNAETDAEKAKWYFLAHEILTRPNELSKLLEAPWADAMAAPTRKVLAWMGKSLGVSSGVTTAADTDYTGICRDPEGAAMMKLVEDFFQSKKDGFDATLKEQVNMRITEVRKCLSADKLDKLFPKLTLTECRSAFNPIMQMDFEDDDEVLHLVMPDGSTVECLDADGIHYAREIKDENDLFVRWVVTNPADKDFSEGYGHKPEADKARNVFVKVMISNGTNIMVLQSSIPSTYLGRKLFLVPIGDKVRFGNYKGQYAVSGMHAQESHQYQPYALWSGIGTKPSPLPPMRKPTGY